MIVVDASVLATAVGDDGPSGAAARAALAGQDLSAPDLVDIETISVLRRRCRAGSLSAARFAQAVDDLTRLPVDRYPALPFLPRAYQLRDNVTPYDAMYLALAEHLGCPLLTAHQRLAHAPGTRCEFRLITDPAD